jgi:hypothetical protein
MAYNYEILGQSASPAFNVPYDTALDANNNVYVADYNNWSLRKIDATTGIVSTIGPTGSPGPFQLITGVAACVPPGEPFGPVNTTVYTYVIGEGFLKIVNTANGATSNNLSIYINYDSSTPPLSVTCNSTGMIVYVPGGIGSTYLYKLTITDPTVSNPGVSVQFWPGPSVTDKIVWVSLDRATELVYLICDKKIYSFNPSTGTFTEITLTQITGNPYGIAVFNSQNIYFTNTADDTVCKCNGSGIITTLSTNYTFNFPAGLSVDANGNIYVADANNNNIVELTLQNVVCFKEGTKILTNQGYTNVEDLRKGDLVKTVNNSFVPIEMIGKKTIYNLATNDRIKDQLYILENDEYPELFEHLVITGCHSVLVDGFESEKQKEQVKEVLGKIYITDGKYRLPACVDTRSKVYLEKGDFTIYHMALENENYYGNYGVFANGLLVETCSRRYLKEYANMTIL